MRGPPDQHLQVSGGKGLRQVVPGAGPERLNAAGYAGVAGHNHDDGVLVGLQRRLQDLEARHLRHVQIHQNDVEFPAADRLQRLLTPPHQGHVVPIHLEHAGAALPERSLVIHYQDPDAGLDLAGDRERIPGGSLRNGRDDPILVDERIGHPYTPEG